MGSANIIEIDALTCSIGKSRVETLSLIELTLKSAHKYVRNRLRIGTIPYEFEKALSARNRPSKHTELLRKAVRSNDVGRARQSPQAMLVLLRDSLPPLPVVYGLPRHAEQRCQVGYGGRENCAHVRQVFSRTANIQLSAPDRRVSDAILKFAEAVAAMVAFSNVARSKQSTRADKECGDCGSSRPRDERRRNQLPRLRVDWNFASVISNRRAPRPSSVELRSNLTQGCKQHARYPSFLFQTERA
jgi:hypothetical protein